MNCYYEVTVTVDTYTQSVDDTFKTKAIADGLGFQWKDRISFTKRCSWHREAKDATKQFVAHLKDIGFQVDRYVITDVLIDSDVKDMFCLVGSA